MNIFKYIANSTWNLISRKGKLKSLSKEDLESILTLNIKTHTALKIAFKAYTAKALNDIGKVYVDKLKSIDARTLPSKDVHIKLSREYTDEARRLESGCFLKAMVEANKELLDVLEDIKKNIDKIVEDKEVSIFNARISYISLLGILRQSDIFCKFFTFYHEQICAVISSRDDYTRLPKYRIEYLCKNVRACGVTTNLVVNQKGRYTFLSEVDKLRRKNNDILLYSNNTTLDVFGKITNYTRTTLTSSLFGIHALNIFAWIGELIVKYKHDKYLRDKNVKEWLEARVALLQMDMARVDPDSPEYVKLQKIVDSYSEMITEYDRKIADYLGDDVEMDENPYDNNSTF